MTESYGSWCCHTVSKYVSLEMIRSSAQVALGKMKTLVNKMMGLNRLYGLAFVTLLVVQVSPKMYLCFVIGTSFVAVIVFASSDTSGPNQTKFFISTHHTPQSHNNYLGLQYHCN